MELSKRLGSMPATQWGCTDLLGRFSLRDTTNLISPFMRRWLQTKHAKAFLTGINSKMPFLWLKFKDWTPGSAVSLWPTKGISDPLREGLCLLLLWFPSSSSDKWTSKSSWGNSVARVALMQQLFWAPWTAARTISQQRHHNDLGLLLLALHLLRDLDLRWRSHRHPQQLPNPPPSCPVLHLRPQARPACALACAFWVSVPLSNQTSMAPVQTSASSAELEFSATGQQKMKLRLHRLQSTQFGFDLDPHIQSACASGLES